MIRALAFDFDGVLVESVAAKGEAFRKLLEGYPVDIQDAAEDHYYENIGTPRREKIRYYHEVLLGQAISAQQLESEALRFGRLAEHLVAQAPLVEGAEAFLEEWYRIYICSVISGTPTDELARLVALRRLSKYFRRVVGSEERKEQRLRYSMTEDAVAGHELVFIGDTELDRLAATQAGVRFVGRVPPAARQHPFAQGLVPLIQDLASLDEALRLLDSESISDETRRA